MKYDPTYWRNRLEQVCDELDLAGHSAAEGETEQERQKIYQEGVDAALRDLSREELVTLVHDLRDKTYDMLNNTGITARYLKTKFP
jgi:hypothetical protein